MDPDLGNARGAGGRAGWIGMLQHPGSSCFTLQHIPAAIRWKQAPFFGGKSHPGGAQGSTTRGGWHRVRGLKRCDLAGIIPVLGTFPGGKAVPSPCLRNNSVGLRAALLSPHTSSSQTKDEPSPASESPPGAAPSPPRAGSSRICRLGMAHGWISKAWDGPALPPRAGCARAAAAA